MNKFSFFMLIVLYLLVVTYFINTMQIYGIGAFSVDGAVTSFAVPDTGFLGQATSMTGTFLQILTFKVTGLPEIIVIIFFIAPVFGLLYIVLDFLKDLVPFT